MHASEIHVYDSMQKSFSVPSSAGTPSLADSNRKKGGCLFICSIIYGTLYSTYPLCHSCSPAEIYFVSSAAKQLHKTLQFRSKYLTNAGKIIILTSFNSFKAVIFNHCAAGDLQMCCRSLWEGSSIVVGPLGDVSLHSTVCWNLSII